MDPDIIIALMVKVIGLTLFNQSTDIRGIRCLMSVFLHMGRGGIPIFIACKYRHHLVALSITQVVKLNLEF